MSNRIEYLVLDVDGTLTDGKIYIGPGGEAMKAFHVRDGYGIRHLLPHAGIIPIIITGRKSLIVEQRCRELGVSIVLQGVADKREALFCYASSQNADMACFAVMGDDLNDLPCMNVVKELGGLTGCPADAVREVREAASFVSAYKGGEGAVRDFIEWLIDRCGKRA